MQNERTKDCDCDKIYMIIKIRIIKTYGSSKFQSHILN